jgi:regulator of nucleoside diphosphate kinase
MERQIFITMADAEQLKTMMDEIKYHGYRYSDYLYDLTRELERAVIVEPGQVSPDLVTMHSRVALVDLDTSEEMLLTLVYPDEADVSSGKISVLAPIGTAMLGYHVGDTFSWKTPGGERRLRVARVENQTTS